MPKFVAALATSLFLLSGGAAQAGTKELIDYVQKLLLTNDLPLTADDALIDLNDGGKRLHMTGQELKRAVVQQKTMTKNYKLNDFKLENADCGQLYCFIRYQFHYSLQIGDTHLSYATHSEEVYVMSGNSYTMIRAFQNQQKEEGL